MAELTVVPATILGGLLWRLLRSSMTAAVLLLHDVGTPGHSSSLLMSLFLPFLCLPLSVSLLMSPVLGFYYFGSFSLNTIGFSLSVSLPVFCHSFSFLYSPPLSFFCLGSIYRAGGAGSTLPRPIIACAWCARRLLCHGTSRGGQWRCCLRSTAARASHHEMGGV